MAVYFDPYYRGTANVGFFNNLGNQAAGIISNLIGQQLTGMFDRAAKAKQVDAARAVMNGVPDISGMNPLQAKQAYMSNPDFWKLSPEMQASLMGNVKTAEQYAGYDTLRKGIEPLYGAPAADMTIGAQQAGYAPANVGQLIERGMPEYKEQLIDQGNQLQYFQRNPYRPGIVSGTTQTFKKGATPGDVLKDQQVKAELAQQKLIEEQRLANALKIANLDNGTRMAIEKMNYNKPQWFQNADNTYQAYGFDGKPRGGAIVGSLINGNSKIGSAVRLPTLDDLNKTITQLQGTIDQYAGMKPEQLSPIEQGIYGSAQAQLGQALQFREMLLKGGTPGIVSQTQPKTQPGSKATDAKDLAGKTVSLDVLNKYAESKQISTEEAIKELKARGATVLTASPLR